MLFKKPPHDKKQNCPTIWMGISVYCCNFFLVHSWRIFLNFISSSLNQKSLQLIKKIRIVGELRNFWSGDLEFTFVITVLSKKKKQSETPYYTCCMSHVTCHMSHVTCHICHISNITCHMSHVTCHMLHVMCHMSCHL